MFLIVSLQEVRRAALSLFATAAQRLPAVLPAPQQLLPPLCGLTQRQDSLIAEVAFGPIKKRVDHGLPLRRNACEALGTLVAVYPVRKRVEHCFVDHWLCLHEQLSALGGGATSLLGAAAKCLEDEYDVSSLTGQCAHLRVFLQVRLSAHFLVARLASSGLLTAKSRVFPVIRLSKPVYAVVPAQISRRSWRV